MTRFALALFLVLAGAGTFVAIRWFMGDSGQDRQTEREQALERERERFRDPGDESETKRLGKSAYEGTLRGFVVDTADRPIEDAFVRMGERTVRTNKDGGYKFAGLWSLIVYLARGRSEESRKQ